jgi:hypothetical protein
MPSSKIETYDTSADEKARKLASSKGNTAQERSAFVSAVVTSAQTTTDIIIRKISSSEEG